MPELARHAIIIDGLIIAGGAGHIPRDARGRRNGGNCTCSVWEDFPAP